MYIWGKQGGNTWCKGVFTNEVITAAYKDYGGVPERQGPSPGTRKRDRGFSEICNNFMTFKNESLFFWLLFLLTTLASGQKRKDLRKPRSVMWHLVWVFWNSSKTCILICWRTSRAAWSFRSTVPFTGAGSSLKKTRANLKWHLIHHIISKSVTIHLGDKLFLKLFL